VKNKYIRLCFEEVLHVYSNADSCVNIGWHNTDSVFLKEKG